MVCRAEASITTPPIVPNSDGVCTLTFENLYAADEASSSDNMKHSSSSEENLMSKTKNENNLKPLSYPDDSLVTGSTNGSSILRAAQWSGVEEDLLPSSSQCLEDSRHEENNLISNSSVDQSDNCSRRTVIINVDVDAESDNRIISAVNYNVCGGAERLFDAESESHLLSTYESLCAASNNIEDDASSNSDLNWLFSHSDSESEFASVNVQSPSVRTTHEAPESNTGLPFENLQLISDAGSSAQHPLATSSSSVEYSAQQHKLGSSQRTHLSGESVSGLKTSTESQHFQGAIPKRRRHGVVLEGVDAPHDSEKNCAETHEKEPGGAMETAGEVSSVTMDLMRRMLDVFSSYPEHCQIDIKKLLVLVSLEQQNSNNRSTVTALGGVAGANPVSMAQGRSSSTLPAQSSPPEGSPCKAKHSTLPSPSQCSSSPSHPSDVTHKLHRKPAVRRRKYGSSSNSSPPVSPLQNNDATRLSVSSNALPNTTTFPCVTLDNITYQPAVLTNEQVAKIIFLLL